MLSRSKWLLPVTLRLSRPYEDRKITLPSSSVIRSVRIKANLSYDLSFSRYKGGVLPNKLIGQRWLTAITRTSPNQWGTL
jgi:hypothetical protein